MLIPPHLDIENVRDLCTARCPMCPISTKKLEPLVMSNAVFEELLQKYQPYRDRVKEITIVGLGEPLVDPGFAEKVRIAKQMGFRVGTVTNGSLLKPALSKKILEAGIDEVLISIDSLNKEIYESIRVRLSFEEVMENTHNFIAERDRGDYKTKIVVRMIRQQGNQTEWDDYLRYWSKYLGKGDMVLWFPIGQWPSLESAVQEQHVLCPYVFDRMAISAEGKLQFCCADTNADFYPLGNVLKQDPVAAFNGEIFLKARDGMRSGNWDELEYCKRCDFPLQRKHRGGVTL